MKVLLLFINSFGDAPFLFLQLHLIHVLDLEIIVEF